jgi:hypothetical protein
MTAQSFQALAVGTEFVVAGTTYVKHSATVAQDVATGEKLRVSAPITVVTKTDFEQANAETERRKFAKDDAGQATNIRAPRASRVERTAAEELGLKAVGFFRQHAKQPYGDRGVEMIVKTVVEAMRLAAGQLDGRPLHAE